MSSHIAPTKLDYNQTVVDVAVPADNDDATIGSKDDTESVIGILITNEAIVDINSSTDSSDIILPENAPPPASITHYIFSNW
jgi:hypothetical protein